MSDVNFEESLKKLQDMCDKIKSQDISLEDAIKCYEEGKSHYKTCKDILDKATQKIEIFEGEVE